MQVKSLYQLTKKLGSVNFLCGLLDLGINNTIDILIYCFIRLEKKGFEEDIVVDVIGTKKRILKLCRKYTLEEITVRRALDRLEKAGLIKIIYKLAFQKKVVHLLPFPGLENLDSDSSTDVSNVVVDENKDSESNTDNSTSEKAIDQQQLIYADKKTRAAGIVIQKENLWKIAKHPKKLIDLAINAYKGAELSQSTHIRNPAGWLISCLEKKYYESYRPEKIAKCAEQELFKLQDYFIDNFGSLPQRFEQLDFFKQKKYEPRTTQPTTQGG